MSDAQSEILLKYRVDQASVQQALAADKQIQEQLNKTGQAGLKLADINQKLNASLAVGLRSQSIDAITEEFQHVIRETGSLEEALLRVEQRLKAVGATDAEIKRVGLSIASIREQETSQRTLGQNITRIGRGVFNAPAIGPSTPIARGLIGAGAVVDKLGIDLKTLALGGAATGVAIGAVVVALDAFNRSLDGSKRLLAGALGAQQNYYEALGDLTSEQARTQLAELRQTNVALEQQYEETRRALVGAFGEGAVTGTNRFEQGVARVIAPEAFAALDEQQKALETSEQSIVRYTQGLESGAFATNDAAAAEEELTRIRQEAREEILAGQTSYGDSFRRGFQLTQEERFKEIESLQHQADAIQYLIDTGNLGTDAIEHYNDELRDLHNEIAGLQDVTVGWGDMLGDLAAREEAISEQTDQYFKALEKEGEIRNDIAEATQAIAEAEAEAQAKLTDLSEDRSQRLVDLEQDKAERIETIAQNSADRIAKIQRDLARSSFEAEAERDVLSKVKAQQSAADALEDQQKADQRQQQQLEKQLEKQERSINRSYERQQQQIIQSLAQQVNTQRQGLQQLNVDLQNAQFAQQAIALNGSNGQRIIHTQMWQDVYNIAANWAVNISNVVNGILGSAVNFAQSRVVTQSYVDRRIDSATRTVFSGQRRITA